MPSPRQLSERRILLGAASPDAFVWRTWAETTGTLDLIRVAWPDAVPDVMRIAPLKSTIALRTGQGTGMSFRSFDRLRVLPLDKVEKGIVKLQNDGQVFVGDVKYKLSLIERRDFQLPPISTSYWFTQPHSGQRRRFLFIQRLISP